MTRRTRLRFRRAQRLLRTAFHWATTPLRAIAAITTL